tara:strand:- start:1345 stop:1584 length:240 start_codon:yes stop_codon:yes gene_type:complete
LVGVRSFRCGLFLAASNVSAAIVFQDNFAAESPGSLLNCTAFANSDVSTGDVNIIAHLGFGIACASGFGSCLDMDSATD